MQEESFSHGFPAGAIGSDIGSGIGAWGNAAGWSQGATNAAMVGGGALSGGFSSSIAGGDFWQGFGIAATVGLVNHVAHNGWGTDPVLEAQSGYDFPVDGYSASDVVVHGLAGASAITGYGSAGLDGMARMGVQTNLRNLKTYELYRSNGALLGNRTVSGSRFLNIGKNVRSFSYKLTFLNTSIDFYQGFQNNHNGYMFRGLFSGAVSLIPYGIGIIPSYYISRVPADYFRTSGGSMKNTRFICFPEGVMITLGDGKEKPIEEIKEGDVILSYCAVERFISKDTVLEILQDEVVSEIASLTLDNGIEIDFSPGHPFYVIGKGWSALDPFKRKDLVEYKLNQLELNDILLIYNNGILETAKVSKVFRSHQSKRVYNIQKVKHFHTFFANRILVRNKY